jgi:hypothetical protein
VWLAGPFLFLHVVHLGGQLVLRLLGDVTTTIEKADTLFYQLGLASTLQRLDSLHSIVKYESSHRFGFIRPPLASLKEKKKDKIP